MEQLAIVMPFFIYLLKAFLLPDIVLHFQEYYLISYLCMYFSIKEYIYKYFLSFYGYLSRITPGAPLSKHELYKNDQVSDHSCEHLKGTLNNK